MTITNGYAALADLEKYIDSQGGASFTENDRDALERCIEAASRFIDGEAGTRFYAASETRYYTADYANVLEIDDLLSVTTLKTDPGGDGTYEETWATTDYQLWPRNAALDSKPYREIRASTNGDYSFPVDVTDGVELVGSFGYASSTPTAVAQAALLIAYRLWRRKDAIFGVAGIAAEGVTVIQARIERDADIMALIRSQDVRVM